MNLYQRHRFPPPRFTFTLLDLESHVLNKRFRFRNLSIQDIGIENANPMKKNVVQTVYDATSFSIDMKLTNTQIQLTVLSNPVQWKKLSREILGFFIILILLSFANRIDSSPAFFVNFSGIFKRNEEILSSVHKINFILLFLIHIFIQYSSLSSSSRRFFSVLVSVSLLSICRFLRMLLSYQPTNQPTNNHRADYISNKKNVNTGLFIILRRIKYSDWWCGLGSLSSKGYLS